MSPRPTISVIITNYNYARYVGETIESVLRQTRLPDEIIVIDDGSTDNSRQVIEHYQDRIAAVFQANEGMNPVKNSGYARSSGDLVMFLDSDDIIYPTAIEAVERAFGPESRRFSSNSISLTRMAWTRDAGSADIPDG